MPILHRRPRSPGRAATVAAGFAVLGAVGLACGGGGVQRAVVRDASAEMTMDGEAWALMGTCVGVAVAGVCREDWVRRQPREDKVRWAERNTDEDRIETTLWQTAQRCEQSDGYYTLSPCPTGYAAWRVRDETANTRALFHFDSAAHAARGAPGCVATPDCRPVETLPPREARPLPTGDEAATRAAHEALLAREVEQRSDADGTWALVASCDLSETSSRCIEHWERTEHLPEPIRDRSGRVREDGVVHRMEGLVRLCKQGTLGTAPCPREGITARGLDVHINFRRDRYWYFPEDGRAHTYVREGYTRLLEPEGAWPARGAVP